MTLHCLAPFRTGGNWAGVPRKRLISESLPPADLAASALERVSARLHGRRRLRTVKHASFSRRVSRSRRLYAWLERWPTRWPTLYHDGGKFGSFLREARFAHLKIAVSTRGTDIREGACRTASGPNGALSFGYISVQYK
jgi:hypothetical protein